MYANVDEVIVEQAEQDDHSHGARLATKETSSWLMIQIVYIIYVVESVDPIYPSQMGPIS